MLRGINRQTVFLDEEDNRHFLAVLELCKEISEYRVYAYCLMGNHVHLLLQTGKEPLELAMKRIGTRYVVWYNAKYDRVGHLFQNTRGRSFCVDKHKRDVHKRTVPVCSLLRFLSEPNEDVCMDDRPSRLNDKDAAKRFCELVGTAGASIQS